MLMKLLPSGYSLAQNSGVSYPLLLEDVFLKQRSLSFFHKKIANATPSIPLPTPNHPKVSKRDGGAVTEAWKIGIEMSTALHTYENEGYYLVAPSTEKKNQTSTSHCKESTGGAVVKWPQRNRKAGQPQPKQLRNPPLFLLFPLQSTFRKPEKLWRKLDMTKQKFEQRINSLVVNFTLEVKLTANNIIPDWILAIHHSPCG